MTDCKHPRGWAILSYSQIKPGTRLIADGDFSCLDEEQEVEVKVDGKGEFYVECREGYHGLDGQVSGEDEGKFVGFWLA